MKVFWTFLLFRSASCSVWSLQQLRVCVTKTTYIENIHWMSENIVKYPLKVKQKAEKMKSRLFYVFWLFWAKSLSSRPRSSWKDLMGACAAMVSRWSRSECFICKALADIGSRASRSEQLTARVCLARKGWNGRRRSGADEITSR